MAEQDEEDLVNARGVLFGRKTLEVAEVAVLYGYSCRGQGIWIGPRFKVEDEEDFNMRTSLRLGSV